MPRTKPNFNLTRALLLFGVLFLASTCPRAEHLPVKTYTSATINKIIEDSPPQEMRLIMKLNSFNGDFQQAEMVRAFLDSFEYRGRFAQ